MRERRVSEDFPHDSHERVVVGQNRFREKAPPQAADQAADQAANQEADQEADQEANQEANGASGATLALGSNITMQGTVTSAGTIDLSSKTLTTGSGNTVTFGAASALKTLITGSGGTTAARPAARGCKRRPTR